MDSNNTPDEVLTIIADYVFDTDITSTEAYTIARACLADALGCAILSLKKTECLKLLGPIVPGTIVPHGSRVLGTPYILDPLQAAFNIGTMIRWLDYNDTWLAAEWGHPSDNLGAIIAISDFMSQQSKATHQESLKVKNLLTALIKAYEIQGVLALENSFNRLGYDHVILVKVASTALSTALLGGNKKQIIHALSHAWIDVGPLRTYRHGENTGSRKSWAAGDATRRGAMFAWMTMQGEMGYPKGFSAKQWGFQDVVLKGKPLIFGRPLSSYVVENILFKVSFPAEFHAQTAVECALTLHTKVNSRLQDITQIEIYTHESAIRIIDKTGPLKNPADRDHCLQYMVAIALIYGTLTEEHYEEDIAKNLEIERLRALMTVKESQEYSKDYLDQNERSIASSLRIFFNDGTSTDRIEVEYPLGHKRRRQEGLPLVYQKFENNLLTQFSQNKTKEIVNLFQHPEELENMTISNFCDLFVETVHA